MKIYIATPVNGRKEGTLAEKRIKAFKRVNDIAEKLLWIYPDAEIHSSFDSDIAPINVELTRKMYGYELPSEAIIMGKCVQRVMECDAIYMDELYGYSKGCKLELCAAENYNKEIIFTYDLFD